MSCSCHPDDPAPRSGHVTRRRLLAGGLAAGLAPFLPGIAEGVVQAAAPSIDPEGRDYAFLPPRPASEKHVRPMMFPVLPDAALGKATWTDTYLAPRSGGRLHEGQDLMGKKMLKLLACVDGTIVELRHSSGGNSLYLMGTDGWYYCYLHINNDDPGTDNGANQFKYAFAPGMAIGTKVRRGDHIAYLGDSGNAEGTGAHCHFEIRMPNAKWYNAAAVNAKYSLEAAVPAALRAKVGPEAFAPNTDVSDFVIQQNDDFLGGLPNLIWARESMDALTAGDIGVEAFIESVLDEPGSANYVAPALRLYLAYFLRLPDAAGLSYWITKARGGTSLDTISEQFARSSEFTNRYGNLKDGDFIDQVYRNLFGRAADSSGMAHWSEQLAAGRTRGWVMRQLCESGEYQRKTRSQVRVIAIYLGMLERIPDPSGYDYWTLKDASSTTGLQALIKQIRGSAGYAARVKA